MTIMRKLNKDVIATIVTGSLMVGGAFVAYKEANKEVDVMNTSIVSERETVVLDIVTEYKRSELNQDYIKNGKRMVVGATAYTNDPITSTGTVPTEGITIAVDPTVIPYGTKVYIPKFNRVFIAEDCGSAIKGNRIDIYMNNYDKAMDWGIRDLEIYILND